MITPHTLLRRPLKAPSKLIPFNDSRICYPMYGSIKYDGFRGLLINGDFWSPELKKFPNLNMPEHFKDVRAIAEDLKLVFDGEVWHPGIPFEDLSSRFRSHNGTLKGVEYHIFDCVSFDSWNGAARFDKTFQYRYLELCRLFQTFEFPNCKLVQQDPFYSAEQAEAAYNEYLGNGQEGMMLRSYDGVYKHGRCTHNECNIYKFKQFVTHDGVITDVIQRRKLKKGLERSLAPSGLMAKVHTQDSYDLDEAVGSFEISFEGKTFQAALGRGFPDMAKRQLWANRHALIGVHVEFKHMEHGAKDKPRIGSVVRFRPDLD